VILHTALKGYGASEFANGFSHTPILLYTWGGKPHDEMTVPYLCYLLNNRKLWGDSRARLYIATFFGLPKVLGHFPELCKIFGKMPSHGMDRL
jgi:hypothetical protein